MPTEYRVLKGPEGFLPPAAALMGLTLPEEGQGSIEGRRVLEDAAIEEAARKLANAKVPTFFPGPLVLWGWNDQALEMASALAEVSESCGINIIPMPDYRPKYPKIDPEAEINPNHPNLTIWHNKIDVCMFVGVHCHYANLSLKIIRGGTNCYTIALCNFSGDDEANLTIRDLTAPKILAIGERIKKMKKNSRGF
jgi:hypothetical protein